MIVFRKLAATAGAGRIMRRYFTENTPEPAHAVPANAERQLDAGGRLTAYYTMRDSRATWRPDMPTEAAKALGINPRLMPRDEELDRLFEGRRADDGEAWSKHERKISAYDFTAAPHKSISLAAEFAPTPAEQAAIWHAIDQANDATMRYIAREVGWARKGAGGEDGADPGAVGWVSFRHHVARPTMPVQDGPGGATYLADVPVDGDPQAHIHNALFNMVATDSGRIGSLDTQRLHARVHEFGAYFQAVLADKLRRFGIEVGYDQNEQAVVIASVPAEANAAFSKGRRQILNNARHFAKEQGLDWDDMSAERKIDILSEAGVAARLAKHGGKTDREIWQAQADALGWSHTGVMGQTEHTKLSDEERFDRAYAFAARHLEREFRTLAVIEHEKVRTYAARGLIGVGIGGGTGDIDKVVELVESRGIRVNGEHAALVVGLFDGAVQVTNTVQVRIEEDLARIARAQARDKSGALGARAIEAAITRSGLDGSLDPGHWEGQRAAIHAMGQGGQLTLLTGVAGAGKTTLLQPLVDAWRADTRYAEGGREVLGTAVAWKQADALRDAGIDQVLAMTPLLDAVAKGEVAVSRNTVLVIDEVSQVAPRQMLALLRLQAETGMTIKMLGDREQAQSIEAGDTIEILRRSLPKAALPELLTTVRQDRERDRAIANLFREGKAEAALALKREDGTAFLAGGDQDQVIRQIADLYIERRDHLRAAGSKRGITISTLTNEDAADISRVVRVRLQERGEISRNERQYQAQDANGRIYDMPIAVGDTLRLYRRTHARFGKLFGAIGNNGSIVTVTDVSESGLTLRSQTGREGEVEWRRLSDPKSKRLLVGFGHTLTVDSAQGITSGEHINALPRGSAGIGSFKGYVAESRATGATWTVISEAAVHEAEKRSRALGDATPVTTEDIWARIGRDMSTKPYKALATDLARAARHDRDAAISGFIERSHRMELAEKEGRGDAVRRWFQAAAMREQLARFVPALTEAVRRNTADLGGLAAAPNAHLAGMKADAEDAAKRLEEAVASPRRQSLSPGPGI